MSIGQQRNASAMRQAILVILLIVVGCAFAYDKLVASRQHGDAWSKIKEVESSDKSGAQTNEDIQEILGKTPARTTNPVEHPGFMYETYSWRRGLLVTTHDIHVVYAEAKIGDGPPKWFYYSASAGKEPDETNFPEKQMIAVNLNPPMVAAGGGPPRDNPSGDAPSGDPPKDDDKSDDDKG